ncbi:MAG TPA: vWA domain-containing protein [Pyrinomonadaceae bacterium]
MRNFSLRLATAFLTFAVGVTASAALLKRAATTCELPVTPVVDKPSPDERTLEMVFVLDTTGSMGGLLEGAKQKIWGIVNEVMQSPDKPAVRVGLVAYRDRGDQYVTQVLPITHDLDKVYTTLMEYRADGGGDGPENVRRALADGVRQAGWSKASERVSQVIFLVGDAPPHDDYQDEPDTLVTTQEAVSRGMIVNTIQCGEATDTRAVWQNIARRGEGRYFAIAQDGGVSTIATPYDSRLTELGGKLGATYMAYGGGPGEAGRDFRVKAEAEQSRTESTVAANAAPVAAADRAANKVMNRDAYVGDLLQSIENGTVRLDAVKDDDLPDALQKLPPAERKKEVERRLAERQKIRDEITSLSKQRAAFIAAERKKLTGAKAGFDSAVADALKEQMTRKGKK